MTNSIWADTVELPQFPALTHDLKTDVLIVGGGLSGLLCAYEMAQAGINYALIEADRLCHGVTRNTTAKITSQHGLIYHKLCRQFDLDTARLYWQANEAALARFRELADKYPCDLETKENYVYTSSQTNQLEAELRALERIGAKASYVDRVPLPCPVSGAIRFANQAQFHPLKFAAGIAPTLNIYEHTSARSFAPNTVMTDRAKITAKNIIIATHFPIINKHGSYFMKMYQHRSYVLALENAPALDGMYVDAEDAGLSFRTWEGLLLLGGGGHRTGKAGGNWTEPENFAQTHYPEARERCRWATQDCMTLDSVPYIGQYSKRTPGLYVATGFNKWGMTSSMVAAMLLRDLIQGKETPYDRVFSPSRTILRPQLFANALETITNLLTISTPRCPHMGCALKWNPQERSWDCSCHGSRFTQGGALLDNPATDNLK